MGAMSELHIEIDQFLGRLGADAGHLLEEGKALFAKLLGEAEADAADLASQEKPVVAAAEADARALAQEAVAGVEGIVDPAKPSA